MSHREKERLAAIFCSDAAVGLAFGEPLRNVAASISQFVIGSREETCGTTSSACRDGGGRLPPESVGAGYESVIGCFRKLHQSREGPEILVVDFTSALAWVNGRGSVSGAWDEADAYFFHAIRTFFGVTRIVCSCPRRREKGLLVATLADAAKPDGTRQGAAGARLFLLRKAVRAGHDLADGKLDVFGLLSHRSDEDDGGGFTAEEAAVRFRETLAFLTSGSSRVPPSGSTLLIDGDHGMLPLRRAGFAVGDLSGSSPLVLRTNGRSNGRSATSC